jgi:hypothetical protein
VPDCEAPVRRVSVPSSPTSKYAALVEACRAHLFVAERIPADETAVPAVDQCAGRSAICRSSCASGSLFPFARS